MAQTKSDEENGTQAETTAGETQLIAAEREAIDEIHSRVRRGNIYEILGVSPDADISFIRKVYYELSRSWHPDQFYRRDLGPYKERLEEVFVGINRAYSILADARRRADYDEEIGAQAMADVAPAPTRPERDTGKKRNETGARHEVSFQPRRVPEPKVVEAPARDVVLESPRRRRRRGYVPGMQRVHRQIVERLRKARHYHKSALKQAEEMNWIGAASNIYLAMQFDPQEESYRDLWAEYDPKSREQMAQQFIAVAENAVSYHNLKAAIYNYRKACDVNPPQAEPFYQLAVLQSQSEEDNDERDILRLLRKAVDKQPDSTKYRLKLAAYYLELDLVANARREYQEVIRREPDSSEGKSGLRRCRR